MDLAALRNQQQAGIGGAELPADNIELGSLLEVSAPVRRSELFDLPVIEDAGDPLQNRPNERAHEAQQLRLAEVDLAAPAADEAPVNQMLQQMEQEDLQAFRILLPLQRITVITGKLCWQVLAMLRTNLLVLKLKGLHMMPHGREFSRVLERVVRSLTVPSRSDYMSVRGDRLDFPGLDFEGLFQVVEEVIPSFCCPLDPVECLERLLADMLATYSVMRSDDVLYISKDRQHYTKRLRALSAALV